MPHRKHLSALAACLLLALAACGGGGSGSPTTPQPETSLFVPGTAGGYGEAAIAVPIAGSVTQSSDTVAGVTANAVHATVALDGKGLLTAAVRGMGWQLQNTSGETLVLSEDWAQVAHLYTLQPYRSAVLFTDRSRPPEQTVQDGDIWTSSGDYTMDQLLFELEGGALGALNGQRGVLFCAEDCYGPVAVPQPVEPDVEDGSTTPENEAILSEIDGLDHRGLRFISESDAQSPPEDSDYLILGFWSYVPANLLDEDGDFSVDDNNLSIFREIELGVFVDGNDPFYQGNIEPLTGTVSYSGLALAAYLDTNTDPVTGTGKLDQLSADVRLTAKLGSSTDNGIISGTVTNFQSFYGGQYADPTSLTEFPINLILKDAPIGNSHSGFFTGDTSMTFDGSGFAGKWGGQFYGNSETDGRPGSAAGTFGAATTDGSRSIIGAFGAYKD